MQITIFGPHRALHSGHYGNWAPNPALELVQLLAGMKDADGKVLIPHFYDGMVPMGEEERKAMAAAPRPAGPPAGTVLHLQVDDADAWFDRAVAAGASARMPLQDMFWGDRYGNVGDPFGHVWSIATPIKR